MGHLQVSEYGAFQRKRIGDSLGQRVLGALWPQVLFVFQTTRFMGCSIRKCEKFWTQPFENDVLRFMENEQFSGICEVISILLCGITLNNYKLFCNGATACSTLVLC